MLQQDSVLSELTVISIANGLLFLISDSELAKSWDGSCCKEPSTLIVFALHVLQTNMCDTDPKKTK